MKTPDYWYGPKGWKACLLWPLSLLYRMGAYFHKLIARPKAVDVPVICVGNFVAGGAGKTPCVVAIAKALQDQNINVHIISRGYKSKARKPLNVDLQKHTIKDVGDEPLMLARHAPTWVGSNRYHIAKAAIAAGAQVILMDDGLHNYQLVRDFNLCVVDGNTVLGNGLTIPAGPLRSPISWVQKNIDAYLWIGQGESTYKPLYRVHIAVPKDVVSSLLKRKYVAFCGIAHPLKFFKTLKDIGLELAAHDTYPDHHPFTHGELTQLMAMAHRHSAYMLTTEKDFVRLTSGWQKIVAYLPIEAQIEGLETLIHQIIKIKRVS